MKNSQKKFIMKKIYVSIVFHNITQSFYFLFSSEIFLFLLSPLLSIFLKKSKPAYYFSTFKTNKKEKREIEMIIIVLV